jgi:hypothetical protein
VKPRPVPGAAAAADGARLDLPLLDLLRLLASFAVVRHHMRGDLLFGVGFGLPLFLVVLLGLATASTKSESPARFARRKASYLLAPWLRWSIVYVVILAAADVARGRGAWSRLGVSMLFAGGEPSLWFLPFAAAAILPVRLLARAAARIPPAWAAGIASAAAVVATLVVARAMELELPDMPVRAWLRVSPALLWGLALGQSARARDAAGRTAILLPVALLAAATLLAPPTAVSGIDAATEDLPRRFGVAVLLACVGFGCPVAVPPIVRRASTRTFGVYLVHPLVGKILGAVLEVLAWPAWIHAAIVWTLSLLLVRGLGALGLPWHELSTGRPRAASPTPATTHREAA